MRAIISPIKAAGCLLGIFLLAIPSRAEPGGGFPAVSGSYVPLAGHPGVFTTQAELNSLATRINIPGSFSARMFARLAGRIQADLHSNTDWDATYSGDDIDVYLHAFSFEPRGGYKNEIVTTDQLCRALNLGPAGHPPAGAAVVAARLALYGSLARFGVLLPPGAPSPDAAVALARHIVLAWAERGFRDGRGHFRQTESQFSKEGKSDPRFTCAGLQIARGVLYSVQAQDILEGLHALDGTEIQRANAFHLAMYDLVRNCANAEWAAAQKGPHPGMNYNNQSANHLAALLATARLLDDRRRFEAALAGNDPGVPVAISWIALFNHLIYGVNAAPLRLPNSGPDGLTSRPSFVTNEVAPGEINDRYRNANPLQGIGYPMFALTLVNEAAEVMGHAGFDGFGYQGSHGQTIRMATDYYAQYGGTAGFYGTVTAGNSAMIPDYPQYVGKIVNGLETNILIGCLRFPHDSRLTGLEAAARTTMLARGASHPDAILFGKWRD